MRKAQSAFAIVMLLVASATAACDAVPQVLDPGSRVWIIPVQNMSGRPAILAVAEDQSPIGDLVGTARPGVIPAGQTIDVTFTVPSDRQGWAIFVNPSPNVGPLITAMDVPPVATGRLPLVISVDQQGNPSVQVPNEPGWFGN